MQLAELVNDVLGGNLEINVQPTNDLRSYHVSSAKLRQELALAPI